FSKTTTCLFFCASNAAMVEPAGPPPTTSTSHSRAFVIVAVILSIEAPVRAFFVARNANGAIVQLLQLREGCEISPNSAMRRPPSVANFLMPKSEEDCGGYNHSRAWRRRFKTHTAEPGNLAAHHP